MKYLTKKLISIFALTILITANIILQPKALTNNIATLPKYMDKVPMAVWDIKQFKDKTYIGSDGIGNLSLLKSNSFNNFEELELEAQELFYGTQDGDYTYIQDGYDDNRPVEAYFRAKNKNAEIPEYVERINLNTGKKENYYFDVKKYEEAYNTISSNYKNKYNITNNIVFEVFDMNICDSWFLFYPKEIDGVYERKDFGIYNVDTNDVHYFEDSFQNTTYIYPKELSNGTVRLPGIFNENTYSYDNVLYIENNKVRKTTSKVDRVTMISNNGEFIVGQNWRGGYYNESTLYKFNGDDYDKVNITEATGPITLDSTGQPWTCIYENNKAYVTKYENNKFVKKYEVSPKIDNFNYQLFLSVHDDNNLIISNQEIGLGDNIDEWITIISDSWNKSNPDLNKDGTIDILDIALISSEYNTQNDCDSWNSSFDFNSDNIIDLFDIIYVSKNILN